MRRWFLVVALIWIFLHVALFIIILPFIPYLGFFPYKDIATAYNLPPILTSLANFDGVHYLLIAKSGYNQYEQAFFPLYPLLIRFFSLFVNGNYLASSLFVSSACFFVGLLFFKLFIEQLFVKSKQLISTVRWSQVFLLAFPTSFFFTTVYTEGLFLMLALGTLLFAKKQRFYIAATFAFLASLTRLVGVFLFIPILFFMIDLYWQKKGKELSIIKFLEINRKMILVFLTPFLGLGIYCFYLWSTVGDPLFFLHAQEEFGANRSSNLVLFPQVIYRYVKIFTTASFNFQYFVSLIEFAVFILVMGVLVYELVTLIKQRTDEYFFSRLGLNIFSFANILLPTFTGTFSSVPRYALMSFSFFIALGEIQNKMVKISLLALFAVFHILLFGFFIQGYFIS